MSHRWFALERAVYLLMTASLSSKSRFLRRLARVGIIINSWSLYDPRTGACVRRHD